MTYHSKEQIEKKLAQAQYEFNDMERFCGKIFVNNGIDLDTGAYPLQVKLSSFISHVRSAIQYAYKECKENNNLTIYESEILNFPILALFKKVRDTDIHEVLVGSQTIASFKLEVDRSNHSNIESQTHQASSEVRVTNTISKAVEITPQLIEQLTEEGKMDLVNAAENQKPLYEDISFGGETDLIKLCDKYIKDTKLFINQLSNAEALS